MNSNTNSPGNNNSTNQNSNQPPPIIEKKIGYSSEAELINEFKQYLTQNGNSSAKENAINYLYYSLMGEVIFGVALEVHYAFRMRLLEEDNEQSENCAPYPSENSSIVENNQNRQPGKKEKVLNVKCSKCHLLVGAAGFATHLAKCMDKRKPRKASQLANKKLSSAGDGPIYYVGNEYESSEKRRKRNNPNGKRNGKTS